MKALHLASAALLLVVTSGCAEGGYDDFVAPTKPLTAEAFCAVSFASVGYGNWFYCGTSQGNLQVIPFPDGARGYCMAADEPLGLVGYSVITYSGGAFPVSSNSRASELTWLLGNQSPGYVRCTRQ